MANLIIKPAGNGSLILQDEGGTAALTVATNGTTTFAANATFSGTANVLGTGSGTLTLNTGSVLNHKAHDDSWNAALPSPTAISGAVLDFTTQSHVGSGITEAGGRYTVSKAGMYWIAASFSNNGTSTTTFDMFLRINASSVSTSRIYQNRNNDDYMGKSGAWAVVLNANDIVDMYGTGNFHSNMSVFNGIRIGGKD